MGAHLDLSFLRGRPVAVLGLGKSGLPAARALAASGVETWAWDDIPARRAEAAAVGAKEVDLAGCDWTRVALLVLSPGIPHTHPSPHQVAAAARAVGCPILCDVALLLRAAPSARVVAITGTNGKSTTTTLIAHLLGAAGRVEVGGNLGPAALSLAPLGRDGTYVLELSSYQLELLPDFGPDVAVLMNITDDHLGRHGGLDGYIAAKRRVFAGQGSGTTAIIGVDDDICRRIADELAAEGKAKVVRISGERVPQGGIGVADGFLVDASRDPAVKVVRLDTLASLPGSHNAQNAAAATAAARACGLDHAAIARGLVEFPGLAHRQERIECVDGVLYVNDSKATNADAAAKALACYDPIYWIAGGLPKEGGIASLVPYFARIRHAFLIGQAAQDFAAVLAPRVPATQCGTLDRAVASAAATAAREQRPGAVVLLSPACASFDQFENFEARGRAFRQAVTALPGRHAKPAPQGAPCA
ncbi:MAG: UDP-N-acetylmuramoyl-L-alanine--D-glutamate ligase [Alphaproteobacteria bacterium]|nr:UDP-N-acetylmuramoyl-L-alanine--D-glutamate ligase [Alphaproteobacteria bacterium]